MDRIKIDAWDYTPDDELYLKYKDVTVVTSYAYDSMAGTVRYEYDPAGSLTAEVHTAQGGSAAERTGYTYDAYNRNTSVCGAGYVQQNHYDAEGLRYAVTENGETTNFVYRNGMPVSELDADKNPVRGYILGNEYISQVNGTTFGYYLNDEQGSVRYLTGSDGSIRNHYRYSAFGETITAEETVPNRLRYNGQMADGLTGLYYLRARYYNASLGRFTQEDVIYNDGLNLYAYCNSNPVMYSDPSGFAKQCDPKVGGEKDSKSGSKPENVFPENPDDLLPEIPRKKVTKANGTTSQTIQTSDNIRIRAEQHPLLPGETYNPRHHGVHYHVEYKVDSTKSWNNKNNVKKWYPEGYTPGAGSGFIPGETFPK